eukprot:TRINITY_DN6816_c0_g1_i1.p1 TRINITY_DN6816_c0_g1~~TRINITY_DN6816_c0_g1_i1.p1  ORF type:complete len:314 (-),score=68.35 TRINITY_DN6816_c0_g1_i1:40-981(-)
MKSCFPDYYAVEQEHGSLTKGFFNVKSTAFDNYSDLEIKIIQAGGMYTFKNGLSTLPEAIADKMWKHIKYNSYIQSIEQDSSKNLTLTISENGKTKQIKASKVISCIPSYELAPLVDSHNSELSDKLKSIDFVDMATINIAKDRTPLASQPAFGYLVTPSLEESILGVTFDSQVMPDMNNLYWGKYTVMMGGDVNAKSKEINQLIQDNNTEEIENIAKSYLEDHINVKNPDYVRTNLLKNGIPKYSVGHSDRINQIENLLGEHVPNLYIAGQSYGGVGINNVIKTTELIVDDIFPPKEDKKEPTETTKSPQQE